MSANEFNTNWEIRRRYEKSIKMRRRKRRYMFWRFILIISVTIILFLGIRMVAHAISTHFGMSQAPQDGYQNTQSIKNEEKALSPAEKLSVIQTSTAYPEGLVEFAQKYEQTINYVYNYPDLKDTAPDIDLSAEASARSVPLLIQWDSRWGYISYGSGLIGYTGCGPVSLSMVALYLTHDAQWTPVKVAEFATQNGYCVPGNGTSWTLFSEGSQALGLKAKELSLSEAIMKNELDRNHPIIAAVGPGDFTYSGHYIVITGYDETGFQVNDPNSRENSAKSWDYDTLSSQIRNLWAISA